MADKKKVLHVRSNQKLSDGSPKLPSADSIDYGELAVNYAAGVETLSIKNSNNEIATFPNRTVATATDIANIASNGNMCVICNMTATGTFAISDSMIPGQSLRVIAHNTSSGSVVLNLPTESPYVLVHGEEEIMLTSDGYAAMDVLYDGDNIYVTVLSNADNSILTFKETGELGDLCLADTRTNELLIVDKDWDFAQYPTQWYMPVGVVVIPSSHDVYGTGECGVMSLLSMSLSTPDSGQTSEATMYWGGYNVDTPLSNLNVVPRTGTNSDPGDGSIVGTSANCYLPNDNLDGAVCPNDENARYYNPYNATYYFAPSPYLSDDSRNPVYSSTVNASGSTIVNAFSDFDGKGNTEFFIKAATAQEDWETADTITNSYDTGYYPAPCCCHRFHTDGTNAGDWYLPSVGELGYVMARITAINETIANLNSGYGTVGLQVRASASHWTSTEYNGTQMKYINTSNGQTNTALKTSGMYVRAFMTTSVSDGNDTYGDVCLYDKTNDKLVIVAKGSWSVASYPTSGYTPIGVVAVPSSHDVYGTGECGVMALPEMHYNYPETGSTSGTSMYLGDTEYDTEAPNFTNLAYSGTTANFGDGTTIMGATGNVYMPSDKFVDAGGYECPIDSNAWYYNVYNATYYSAPSPYLTDGSRNPLYYSTESPSSTANCLADFDGIGNTDVLIGLATEAQGDAWKTEAPLTNSYDAGYYPPACCCNRFHTEGTSQGQWYLPAAGELGYVIARYKAINETITKVRNTLGTTYAVSLATNYYWSSSEYSAASARYLLASNGNVGNANKHSSYRVRAFVRA